MGRACSTNVEKRNAYMIMVEKPEGNRPLASPRRRWVDNMKTDLRKIGWGSMDWIDLAQDRDQWREPSCEHRNKPSGSIKYWELLE
jgi:hypothetical protein